MENTAEQDQVPSAQLSSSSVPNQNDPSSSQRTNSQPASTNYWKLATGFLLLLLILCGIAFAYVMMKKPASQSVIAQATPTPQTIPAANSNTYTSKDGLFSFQYPADFQETESQRPYYSLSLPIVSLLSKQTDYQAPNYDQQSVIAISTTANESAANCFQLGDQTQAIHGTTFYIENHNGTGSGNAFQTTFYRTEINNTCFEISLTVHTDSDWNGIDMNKAHASETSAMTRLNQILATFHFTDQNQTADTSGWQSYHDPIDGFSFKYPSSWKVYPTLLNGKNAMNVQCSGTDCGNYNTDLVQITPLIFKTVDEYMSSSSTSGITDQQKAIFNGVEIVTGVKSAPNGSPEGSSIVRFFVYKGQGYRVVTRFPGVWNKSEISDFPTPVPDIFSTFTFDVQTETTDTPNH